ncbi:alpha/beta hydrolase [Thalassospira sp. TSL5-1]|uniref:alpha/beta hydrolase n=1 Tax=Thalassospira sp. TSL5-1 TaxID=1544451 RepID=UPI00093E9636|nr:alpha/beta hydrolase [Thalassospira sp. TSL5-1]OKH87749.1 alpha/beta hydrolase [Thalassospira sp. TSL5-1]
MPRPRLLVLASNALMATLLLAGCDRLGAFNSLQAGDIKPAITDLPYGPDARQKMDIYLPTRAQRPAPLMIWFYGGAWRSGDKAKYAFVAKRFTDMGYAVAIPDYRLAPKVTYPAFVQDSAQAVKTAKAFAQEHPADISGQKLILAGHSAGAYNAMQLVARQTFLQKVGLTRDDIAGIIGLSGPYDFYPYDVESTRSAFDDTPGRESQPVNQDLATMPPLLLITGEADHTVLPRNSIRLAKLAPNATLVKIPDMSHVGTVVALGTFLTGDARVTKPIDQFLAKVAPIKVAK